MFKFCSFHLLLAVKAPSTIFARVLVYVADCVVYSYAFIFLYLLLMAYNFYSLHILLIAPRIFFYSSCQTLLI